MVRGIVAETIIVDKEMWIGVYNPADITQSKGIWTQLDGTSFQISPGDMVWWYGDVLYWNAENRVGQDVRLKRLVNKPEHRPHDITVESLVEG